MGCGADGSETSQGLGGSTGWFLSQEEELAIRRSAGNLVDFVRSLDRIQDWLPAGSYARDSGRAPREEEDPLHAWYRITNIRGATDGPLAGKRVAIKDNICVAGVPMMNGASYMEGTIPEADATVVSRLLHAGAVIAGKANCEYLCFSGDSYTNSTGPTRNPYAQDRSAGGSSSGSAALVGSRAVDMALGCDQGGSIRIPSAWCGVYGMKPTWGLVPYTGIFPVEVTLDHVGPITANVYDNALMLEILAGEDGIDSRQTRGMKKEGYREWLAKDPSGLRIGVLKEGFGQPGAEHDVEEKVMAAISRLEGCSVSVREISVPLHRIGPAIWSAIVLEGGIDLMMWNNAGGTNRKDLYIESLCRAQSRWRLNPVELPAYIRASILAASMLRNGFGGRYYRKAQNLVRMLKGAYDAGLCDVDVFVMPTVPFKAKEIPAECVDGTGTHYPVNLEIGQTLNTSPFNCTGHPALSIPCGMSEGLPIGMMLVGREFKEGLLYQVAAVLEELGDWRHW
jgi:amidase